MLKAAVLLGVYGFHVKMPNFAALKDTFTACYTK